MHIVPSRFSHRATTSGPCRNSTFPDGGPGTSQDTPAGRLQLEAGNATKPLYLAFFLAFFHRDLCQWLEMILIDIVGKPRPT
jgi:hypothetical protein